MSRYLAMLRARPAALLAAAILAVGLAEGWGVALSIVTVGLISAIMAVGLNLQWAHGGVFNAGVAGFVALGGVAGILVSHPVVPGAWSAGGTSLALAALALMATVAAIALARRRLSGRPRARRAAIWLSALAGMITVPLALGPGSSAIEAIDPSRAGFLGGFGLPVPLGWLAGALLAAAAADALGRLAGRLRLDYFAIATIGAAEIVITVIRNEAWIVRGVKNVTGLPGLLAHPVEIAASPLILRAADALGLAPVELASRLTGLARAAVLLLVLGALIVLVERALAAQWGRTLHAVKDDERAAAAMGIDADARRRQAFVLGSAILGLAGAMLASFEGQFTPGSYTPLRFTFLVWVMMMVGGAGSSRGAALGAMAVWLIWIEAEPAGRWFFERAADLPGVPPAMAERLATGAPYLRMVLMGVLLLVILRLGTAPPGHGSRREHSWRCGQKASPSPRDL